MKGFPIKHKIIAVLLALTFTFQSMSSINWHTYSSKSDVHICIPFGGCFFPTPTHLSYFCNEYHRF